jgi:GTP cyclohydrolase I
MVRGGPPGKPCPRAVSLSGPTVARTTRRGAGFLRSGPGRRLQMRDSCRQVCYCIDSCLRLFIKRQRQKTLEVRSTAFAVTILAMSSPTAADMTPTPPDDEGTPVSVKIRERLAAARKRFHANDSLVINTEGDHNTQNTARRVAKMYINEVFKGRYVTPPTITEFPNAEHLNELMIVGPITVRSACSHHFCPVIGKIWIGVMPNEHTNVIGLSKYARLVDWVMGRPQIQEEAVVQLADLIMEKTQPDGLAIVMEASHFCMSWRGVREMDSKMINSVMRGVFLKDSALRREFLSLIPGKN